MFKIFILLYSLSIGTSEVANKTDTYQSGIDSGSEVAESIWALTRLYHAADSIYQELILERLNDEYLKDGLQQEENEFDTIYRLNNHLENEELLLYLLLQIESQNKRETLFLKFYNSTENQRLKTVNTVAKNGGSISSEYIDVNTFTFVHFLIDYYDLENNIRNDEFYGHFTDYWIENLKSIPSSGLSRDIHFFTIFNSLYKKRKFEDIQPIYSELISIKHLPYSILKRNLYWDLEFAMYQLGAVDKSIEVQRKKLIPIVEHLGAPEFINRIYSSHGGYLYLLGNYIEAREVFNMALKNKEKISDSGLTLLYNNLSLVYYKTGENSRYIDTQLQALEHARSLENHSRVLTIFRNLHIFYRKNKNWDLAEQYIDRAEELALELDNIDDLISVYNSKAVYLDQYLNDVDSAKSYLEKAESHFNSETEIRTRVRVLYEKAKLLNKNQEYTDSRELLTSIISDWSSELNTPAYLDILLQIANVEYLVGNR